MQRPQMCVGTKNPYEQQQLHLLDAGAFSTCSKMQLAALQTKLDVPGFGKLLM